MIDASKSLAAAADVSLEALELPETDVAAGRLARKYCAELDQAAVIDRAASKVLDRVIEEDPENVDLHEAVQALRNKLASRTALTTIGSRLESLLADLGATPGGRARQGKKPAEPGGNWRDKLRAAQ